MRITSPIMYLGKGYTKLCDFYENIDDSQAASNEGLLVSFLSLRLIKIRLSVSSLLILLVVERLLVLLLRLVVVVKLLNPLAFDWLLICLTVH